MFPRFMVISAAWERNTPFHGAMASLNHWGVKRIYRYGLNVFAPSWDDMSRQRRRIRRTLDSKAKILPCYGAKSGAAAEGFRELCLP